MNPTEVNSRELHAMVCRDLDASHRAYLDRFDRFCTGILAVAAFAMAACGAAYLAL